MPRILLVVACSGAFALALAAEAVASEMPHSIGLYPVAGGALAMVDSKIELSVRGPIVEAVITQRFRNPGDRVTEATYIFPLPADAAVTAMAIRTGARTIHASVETRDAAQRRYEAAVAAGASAARLDQERPDVFTQSVAAIPAQGTVEITLRVDTVARYHAGTWELALPMLVAPRYVPGTASGRPTTGSGRSPDTDRAPDASHVTPIASPGAGGATHVVLHFLDKPLEITSPTHQLERTGNDASFVDPHSDHDAIVRWRVETPAAGWVEQASDGAYAAVVVSTPAPTGHGRPTRSVLVLDRAATTRGDGEAVERLFVHALLSTLAAADRIAVAGSLPIPWSPPADALRAIDQQWAAKATPFDLTRALVAARPERAPLVLITDGLVADDRAAIAAARALGSPIHVIGIGPAPARGLLTQLAAVSGGTIRFAIPGDDLGALATDVVADLASPPAALAVNWGALAASEVVPQILPHLGANQAMLVLARVAHVQAANARAGGELFAIETAPPSAAVDGAVTPSGPLARRWAKTRLDELVATSTTSAVTAHALAHGLVSPYTSMVAIGSEIIIEGGVKHSIAVPVSVPAGMQWEAVRLETSVDTLTKTTTGEDVYYRAHEPDVSSNDDDAKHDEDPMHKRHAPPARPAKPAHRDVDVSPAKSMPSAGVAAGASPAPEVVAHSVADLDGQGDSGGLDDRQAPVSESQLAFVAESGRAWRFSLGAGGGVAIDHGTNEIVAINARAEHGVRTLVGGEASLWFVGGLHGRGRGLLTIARRGIGSFLELGAGVGVELGDGTGLASSLRLRVIAPSWLHTGAYLRYDNAAIFRTTTDTEHVLTLGIDWAY